MAMNWHALLSRRRLPEPDRPAASATRTDFQRDFDRIVFSSAFRRMQDKTQVFPLSNIDYVRTRLTHSLEASSVGRSLGTLVGEQILRRHELQGYEAADFGSICAAACLAHDIGNPPFGHSGEDGFRHWSEHAAYGRQRVAALRGSAREDFTLFEGNAQGFRVVTRLQNRDNPGGLQLTAATLGAFTKYPRESWLQSCQYQGVSAKKHGFFQQDRVHFERLAEELGLIRRHPTDAVWCRHPLAFLVEAADDICYRVIDIEDGFRVGILSYGQVLELFLAILGKPDQQLQRVSRINGDKEKVEFLRAKVINAAVGEVRDAFLDLEQELLEGRFDRPLLEVIPAADAMAELIRTAERRIYCTPQVVEIEAAGFQVIGELLENLIQVLDDLAERGERATARSRMFAYLIPEQFVGPGRVPSEDFYSRLLGLTDFIAGMTDSYAVSLYKRLTGISLPGG